MSDPGGVLSAEDREALAGVIARLTEWRNVEMPAILAAHRAVAADAARAELVARVLGEIGKWDCLCGGRYTCPKCRLRALVAPDHAETDRGQG